MKSNRDKLTQKNLRDLCYITYSHMLSGSGFTIQKCDDYDRVIVKPPNGLGLEPTTLPVIMLDEALNVEKLSPNMVVDWCRSKSMPAFSGMVHAWAKKNGKSIEYAMNLWLNC